jgi:hypothetical protein
MMHARLVAMLIWAVFFAAGNAYAYKASVLIDFDPQSAGQTVIVESIAVDHKDMLYACDRVSGNVWRIDPKKPKLVVVGRVPEREIGGKKVRANVSGIVFNAAGDLYLTAGGFSETGYRIYSGPVARRIHRQMVGCEARTDPRSIRKEICGLPPTNATRSCWCSPTAESSTFRKMTARARSSFRPPWSLSAGQLT